MKAPSMSGWVCWGPLRGWNWVKFAAFSAQDVLKRSLFNYCELSLCFKKAVWESPVVTCWLVKRQKPFCVDKSCADITHGSALNWSRMQKEPFVLSFYSNTGFSVSHSSENSCEPQYLEKFNPNPPICSIFKMTHVVFKDFFYFKATNAVNEFCLRGSIINKPCFCYNPISF